MHASSSNASIRNLRRNEVLEAINTLHFRLDDASADLRALDPDATLREIYRDELNHLED
jgi:hypothetical protein